MGGPPSPAAGEAPRQRGMGWMSDKSGGSVSRALVVGGGLAGLTAAAALGQIGVAVDVVDISDRAEGTGIGLQNRGPDALDAVGVLDAVIATGAARDRVPVRFFDAAGGMTLDPQWQPRADGKPAYILVYRPLLASILRARAEATGAQVRIGPSVAELAQDGDGVDVRFTDRSEEHTSELQSRQYLVCRLLLEKKKKINI